LEQLDTDEASVATLSRLAETFAEKYLNGSAHADEQATPGVAERDAAQPEIQPGRSNFSPEPGDQSSCIPEIRNTASKIHAIGRRFKAGLRSPTAEAGLSSANKRPFCGATAPF
jgi:hypothetical protein